MIALKPQPKKTFHFPNMYCYLSVFAFKHVFKAFHVAVSRVARNHLLVWLDPIGNTS